VEFAPEGANKNVGADSISARRATADGRALFLSRAQRRDPPNLFFIISKKGGHPIEYRKSYFP
uniref:hypothetical protein n=1 Tax=Gemmiger formicilis TaxID=745368 RepID=UPI004029BA6B